MQATVLGRVGAGLMIRVSDADGVSGRQWVGVIDKGGDVLVDPVPRNWPEIDRGNYRSYALAAPFRVTPTGQLWVQGEEVHGRLTPMQRVVCDIAAKARSAAAEGRGAT